MTETEKAYIAGLFDGEGSVCFSWVKASKNGKRYGRLTAKISNNHKETLEWVREKVGCGTAQLSMHPVGRDPQFFYYAAREHARIFLHIVKPFLHIKLTAVEGKLAEDAKHCRRRSHAAFV